MIGDQVTSPTDNATLYYIPFAILIEFIFYMGWIRVRIYKLLYRFICIYNNHILYCIIVFEPIFEIGSWFGYDFCNMFLFKLNVCKIPSFLKNVGIL